jgi:hypothetical protein
LDRCEQFVPVSFNTFMNIFIHRDGQQLGPFGEAEVKSQLTAGTISRQDLAWWEGQAGWVPLEQAFLAVDAAPSAPAPISSPTVAPAVSAAMPAASTASAPIGTSGMAIGALISGIAGLFVGIIFLVPIILGYLALSQIRKNPYLKGSGMALAGLILGYVEGFIVIIAVVAIFVLIALGSQVKSVFSTINAQLEMAQTNNAPGTNAAPAHGP